MPKSGKLNSSTPARRPEVLPVHSASENRPYITLYVQGKPFTALVDTGSVSSFVGPTVTRYLDKTGIPSQDSECRAARVIDGRPIHVTKKYELEVGLEDEVRTHQFLHIPAMNYDMLLGMDFLQTMDLHMNFRTGFVFHRNRIVSLPPAQITATDNTATDNSVVDSMELKPSERQELEAFLAKELPLFDSIQGPTNQIQHHIRVTTKIPIKQRYRPQNPKMQEVINTEVDRMLEEDIIEPSSSPWSSPIVIVKKKDGKPRFCIDFRKVNQVSEKDAYPLPFISAILDRLREARYISSLDLKQGYWQIPLDNKSRPITAFTVSGRGLFQFKVLPFGLHSAPATFQRLLDTIIGPEMEPYAFAYLDDIIVLGKTFEEHLYHLREVFRRLRKANLRINPEKCHFCQKSIKYLGHVVSNGSIQTDPDKVDAIRSIPPPSNVKGLRRFLGVASWYRRFIPSFSELVAPLTRLLRKNQPWNWTEEQGTAFETVKERLTEAPVLACPDFSKPFVLQTDASDYGIGAALTQTTTDGDKVIAYASRTLNPAERNYSVTEKECLAIVWGIEKMRPYLEGYRFTVVSDHQSLKWLHAIKSPSGRLARWSIFLQQYDFDIKYRKGILNKVADTLSRDPLPFTEAPLAETGTTDLQEVPAVEELPNCSWYRRRFTEVQQHPDQFPDYRISDNRLYRHFFDNQLKDEELSEPWKLCVPKPLRRRVLEENHDAPTAGHLGTAKTVIRLAQRYYWPGMFRDAAKYVRSCLHCQRFKVSQQRPHGRLQPTPNRNPWETVSTDLVGPLPRSTKGNRYIAVFQDRFTKWIQVRALRRATAATVSQALFEEVITRFGTPKTVISDNGVQYDSRTFKQLLQQFGIHHRLTPPYTPQDNPVERANRTIKTMIAQFCDSDHRKWDQHLPSLVMAVNSVQHESTGFSPAFLNYGREFALPGSLHRENQGTEDPEEDFTEEHRTVHQNRLEKLRDIYKLVRLNLSRAFTVQSRHYNLRHREWRCRLGDRVLKREHPLSSGPQGFAAKLAPKFSGPYVVCRVLSPVVYNLKDATGKRVSRVHIRDLKAYRS